MSQKSSSDELSGHYLPVPLVRSRLTPRLQQQVVEVCGPLLVLTTRNPQCQDQLCTRAAANGPPACLVILDISKIAVGVIIPRQIGFCVCLFCCDLLCPLCPEKREKEEREEKNKPQNLLTNAKLNFTY